jgi:hypothetical protein
MDNHPVVSIHRGRFRRASFVARFSVCASSLSTSESNAQRGRSARGRERETAKTRRDQRRKLDPGVHVVLDHDLQAMRRVIEESNHRQGDESDRCNTLRPPSSDPFFSRAEANRTSQGRAHVLRVHGPSPPPTRWRPRPQR